MTTFVLIPGAGGSAWSWHLVEPLLRAAGHDARCVDLPADDVTAGLAEYADAVAQAASGADDVVLVALSFGGFTAPLVAERIPVAGIVLANAMIPLPGERADDWWKASGSSAARWEAAQAAGRSGDLRTSGALDDYFFHDVDPAVAAQMRAHDKDEISLAMSQSCDFGRWPDVPLLVLTGREDRLFPAAFQAGLARDRLGIGNRVIPGGHLIGLANPSGTAAALLAFRGATDD